MFGTFRKHSQLLWWIIIAGTIVSFVIFFNPGSRYGNGGGGAANSGDTGASIEGRPITMDEFNDAVREELLFYFLQHGEWASPDKLRQGSYQLDNRAYQRIALNQKAKDLGINPTAKAAARMTEEIFGVKPGESVSAENLAQFEQRTLAPNHLTLDDFARFARHQAANQELVTLFGMSGKLITPKEAESFYIRENEPMVAEIAYFPLSNYMASVKYTPKDIEGYFKTNEANYRLPERIQLQYVIFEDSNYVAQAQKDVDSNTNAVKQIDAYYLQQGAKSFVDANGKEMTPEAAKAEIKKKMVDTRAMIIARTNAIAFTDALDKGHDDEHPFTAADLPKIAQERHVNVMTTEPFDARNGPKDLKVTQPFMRTAFILSTNAPDDKSRSMMYSPQPVPVENGWVVMGLLNRLPSVMQTQAQVQDEVITDYKREKAFYMAREAGQKFDMNAQIAAAQGKSFDAIAKSDNVATVTLPPFSLAEAAQPTNIEKTVEFKQIEKTTPTVAHLIQGHQAFQQLVETIYPMAPGRISPYIPTPEGGYVIHLKARQPVDKAKMERELPDFLARMREQRQSAAFAEWFQKQMQDMRLIVPQQKQPMS